MPRSVARSWSNSKASSPPSARSPRGYAELLAGSEWQFFVEAADRRSNYWLNAVICEDRDARDALLKQTNDRGVGTRPVWTLMHHLPMYANCVRGDVSNAELLESRIVNLPSSVPVAEVA